MRFVPGWIAVVAAAGLLAAALVDLIRPPVLPDHQRLAVASRDFESENFLGAVRAVAPRSRPPPDPFRLDGAATGDRRDPGPVDAPGTAPPYIPPPPRVVGTGRRPDGLAFIGCEAPGQGIVIVREGELCGAFRLMAVGEDSVSFSVESTDSVVVVAPGDRR